MIQPTGHARRYAAPAARSTRAPGLRRAVAALILFAATAAPVTAGEIEQMSVEEAHRKAVAGEVVLIDVRSPEEWRDTGIGEAAHPVSMHRPDFMTKLTALTGGNLEKPIALICARGGRSNTMAQKLYRLGYRRIIDVASGMLGSRFGPGWLSKRLPTTPYTQ